MERSEGFREELNPYIGLMKGRWGEYTSEMKDAKEFKGSWRTRLGGTEISPLDLEIGTGNGYFFEHQSVSNPNRLLIGVEKKYKPLVQSIKRARTSGAENCHIIQGDAELLDECFECEEIDNIYFHFPDPWPKRKQRKNRLIDIGFVNTLFSLQKDGGFLDFKTDNLDYFEWAHERIVRSPYRIERLSRNLHESKWVDENFETHFEKLWVSKGLKINYIRAYKRL